MILLPIALICGSISLVFGLPIQGNEACSYSSPNLTIDWKVDSMTKNVIFNLRSLAGQDDYWTGIFFGDNKPADAVIAFVRSGQFGQMDGHVEGDEIIHDETSNVDFLKFSGPNAENDQIEAEFSRNLASFDKNDSDFSGCITFFFPNGVLPISSGGSFLVPDLTALTSHQICDLATSCQQDLPEKIEKEEELDLVKREDGSGGGPVCDWNDGGSSLHWTKANKGIKFSVTTEAKKGKWWSAIGVGEGMTDLKLAIVFTQDGKVKQAGGYTSTGYQTPAKAKNLKVTLNKKSVKSENGQLSFDFMAPDELFAGADANGCVTLQIGINAGNYQGNFKIGKHDTTPVPFQVCNIHKCGAEDPKPDEKEPEEDTVNEGSGEETGEDSVPGLNGVGDETNPNEDPLKDPNNMNTIGRDEAIPPNIDDILGQLNLTQSSSGSIDQDLSLENQQPSTITNPLIANLQSTTTVMENLQVNENNQSTQPINPIRSTTNNGLLNGDGNIGGLDENPLTSNNNNNNQLLANETEIEPKTEKPSTEGSTDEKKEGDQANETKLTTAKAEMIELGEDEEARTQGSGSTTLSNDKKDWKDSRELVDSLHLNEKKAKGPWITTGFFRIEENKAKEIKPHHHQENEKEKEKGEMNEEKEDKDHNPITVTVHSCRSGHTDLRVCQGYFADYLGKVEQWAQRHGETMSAQLWKACSLLSGVPNVVTMCCQEFHTTCKQFIHDQ